MSDTIARGVIELAGNADQFFATFAKASEVADQAKARIEAAAQQIGQALPKAGETAKRGVDGIKEGTKQAADGLDNLSAAARRYVRENERLAASLMATSREQATAFAGLQRGIPESLVAQRVALQKLVDQQRAAATSSGDMAQRLGLVGVSAGQATNALRQLPAQFTDIFTSLAAGQPAITVFLQQGGQIKDMFGGLGNALRALGSVFTPVRVAIGGLAAAVVGLAYAYKAGSAEADEYRRAIVLTGNAAGTTVSQLTDIARAVSQSVGTQGKAAETLAKLAATGRVASADLGKLAEAAIRLEREGGPAVEKTIEQFAELGKDPTKAVAKLNETTNFLTIALFRQIKALQDSGREATAARLAQESYANAVTQRSKTLESQLGSLERGWRAVADAAKWAWDKMLNIGRPDSLRQQLADLEKKLEIAKQTTGRISPDRARFIEEGSARAELLREQIVLSERSARAEAARAEAVRKAIDADMDAKKGHDSVLDRMRADAKAWADQILKFQDIQRDATKGTYDLTKAEEDLIKVLSDPAWQRYSQGMQQATIAEFLRADAAEKFERWMKKAAQAREESLRVQERAVEATIKETKQAEEAAEKLREETAELLYGKDAREALIQIRMDMAAATAAQNAATAAALDFESEETLRLWQLAQALKDVAAARRARDAASDDKAAREDAAKRAADVQKEWDKTAEDIRQSLTDAFRRAFESGENFGTAFAKTIEREIKTRIAAAIAGSFADAVLAFVGITRAAQGTATAAGGAGSWVNTAGTAGNLYAAGQRIYGMGQSAYNWGAQAYATYAGNMAGSTSLYTGMANQQVLAAYGVDGAGATAGGVTGSQGAASGSTGAGMYGLYAAIAIKSYQQAQKDYREGFRSEQSRDAIDRFGPGISPAGGAETYVADIFRGLGMSDRWAEVLSGASHMARIFGRSAPQIMASGVTGTLSGGGFQGQLFADIREKGGWLRSDKNWTELRDLPEELGRFLSSAAKSVHDQSMKFGEALGLPADALSTIASDIKITLTDDIEANKKAITDALAGYGQKLVESWSDALRPLAMYGETAADTIARVGAAITSVNDVLEALGKTALAASIDGGQAAIALQELFGGLDTLAQAASSFANNFLSTGDRTSLVKSSLGNALEQVGLAVPATRDAFRDLVRAQDLSTDAGRRAFTVLMSVADAFASVTRSADDILSERQRLTVKLLTLQGDTTELRRLERDQIDDSNKSLYDAIVALEDLQTATDAAAASAKALSDAWASATADFGGGVQSAFAVVATQIENEKQRLQSAAQAEIQALEQRAQAVQQAFRGLIDSLGDAIASINDKLSGGGRDTSIATLRDAADTLRRGGSVDMDAVRAAATKAAQLDTSGFGSRLEFARALANTSTLLRDVQGAARTAMSTQLGAIAAQQVRVEKLLEDQIKSLDDQLVEARSAAESLVSIDDGIKTVAQAIQALTDAIGAMSLVQGGGGPVGRWLRNGSQEVWGSAAGAVGVRDQGSGLAGLVIRGRSSVFSGVDALAFIDAKLAEGDPMAIYSRAQLEGISLADINQLKGWKAGTAEEWARSRGLPVFHAGTPVVPSTGLALLEGGERVMSTVENERIVDAITGGRSSGRGDALLSEVLAELRELRKQAMANDAAIASYTNKAARLLDDVVNGGASVATRAEA